MGEIQEIRINKFLSDAGVCSRREADRLLEEGRITVNGETAVMGMKVDSRCQIDIDNKPIKIEDAQILIAFHKPRGIVCTSSKQEKNNIIDYLHYDKRIYPIGRLDKESEGLILLTNQGELVDKILRGSHYHEKEYIVEVNKKISKTFLKGMREGVPILETITRPCMIRQIDDYSFQIILTQGLNRQIRRMCEYFGYQVAKLKRVRVMNILLGDLKIGKYRNVTKEEWDKLEQQLR